MLWLENGHPSAKHCGSLWSFLSILQVTYTLLWLFQHWVLFFLFFSKKWLILSCGYCVLPQHMFPSTIFYVCRVSLVLPMFYDSMKAWKLGIKSKRKAFKSILWLDLGTETVGSKPILDLELSDSNSLNILCLMHHSNEESWTVYF